MKFKKVFSAALVAGLVLATGAASAFPTFTIQPSVYGGPAGTLVGDKFNGDYREVFTFGTTVGGITPFDVSIRFVAATLANTNNGDVFNAIQTGLGVNYALYGLFVGSGTASSSFNAGTGNTVTMFNATSGNLRLFVDPGTGALNDPSPPNTTFSDPANGSTPFNRFTFADDQLIATGSLITGSGTATTGAGGACPSNNCGSFGQTTTFALQNSGSTYFINPVPFFNLSTQTGQFNGVPVASGTNATANGSLDVQFNNTPTRVPEPSTIALFGLALAGLGIARRRKS